MPPILFFLRRLLKCLSRHLSPSSAMFCNVAAFFFLFFSVSSSWIYLLHQACSYSWLYLLWNSYLRALLFVKEWRTRTPQANNLDGFTHTPFPYLDKSPTKRKRLLSPPPSNSNDFWKHQAFKSIGIYWIPSSTLASTSWLPNNPPSCVYRARSGLRYTASSSTIKTTIRSRYELKIQRYSSAKKADVEVPIVFWAMASLVRVWQQPTVSSQT